MREIMRLLGSPDPTVSYFAIFLGPCTFSKNYVTDHDGPAAEQRLPAVGFTWVKGTAGGYRLGTSNASLSTVDASLFINVAIDVF